MNSALTRLFLKLPGCEIDLDAREFDSTTDVQVIEFYSVCPFKFSSLDNFIFFRLAFQFIRHSHSAEVPRKSIFLLNTMDL